MAIEIPNQRIEKIKQSADYQKKFADEWSKCVVAPSMIPDAIQDMVCIHFRKTGFSALNLRFDAYKALKHDSPATWDINRLQIAVSIAMTISEDEYNLHLNNLLSGIDYTDTIEKLVTLHEIISTMFLECEKKCINSIIFAKQLGA